MSSVIVIDPLCQPCDGARMLEVPLGGSQSVVLEACLARAAGLRYPTTQRMLPEDR